jgi:hypothetical protein
VRGLLERLIFDIGPNVEVEVGPGGEFLIRPAAEVLRLLPVVPFARSVLRDEMAEAREKAAAEALAGKAATVNAAEVEAGVNAKIALTEGQLGALNAAVDEEGNLLAEAIDAARAEWLDQLGALEQDALDRARTALAELGSALGDLGPARGGPAWLQSFDVGAARAGAQRQFAGGSIRVDTTQVVRESQAQVGTVLAPVANVLS